VTATGRGTTLVRPEPGQVGIREPRVSSDGAAGWLVEFRVRDVTDAVALTLTIWRAGKVVRRFQTDQSFYSWAFYGAGQVAYHVGPLHGERASHCELRDIKTGHLIEAWDGDLESANNRPPWVGDLSH